MQSINLENIKLCVFDMAGTSVDEDNLVYKTLHSALLELDVKTDLQTCLLYGAGKEKYKAIVDILSFLEQKSTLSASQVFEKKQLADRAFELFKTKLEKNYNSKSIKEFDGMTEFFEFLHKRKIKIALNTGYDRKTAQKILDILGWQVGVQIDALITADDVTQSRPAPDMIFLAMEKTQISSASQVLKAGDSAIDIEEGRNAKCAFLVAVLSGAQDRVELEKVKPNLILDSLTDLKKYF